MLKTVGVVALLLPVLLGPVLLVAVLLLASLPAAADQGGAFVVPNPTAGPPAREAGRRRSWGVLPVRTEDRPQSSRLLFPFAHATPFTATRTGDVVALRFRTSIAIGGTSVLAP